MSDKKIGVDKVVFDGREFVPLDSVKPQVVPFQEGTVGLWQLGKKYFVRTVTYHLIGKLAHVDEKEMLFTEAVWVASSGKFGFALATGKISEYEVFMDPVILGRGGIIDATEWRHATPGSRE